MINELLHVFGCGFEPVASIINPDSKVHGANMGPIWGRQDPGGPHVGPMNFAIWKCDMTLSQAL